MQKVFTFRNAIVFVTVITVIAIVAFILTLVFWPKENGGFFKRTIWESSFSRGWGIEYNSYEDDQRFKSIGLVFVRTGRSRENESRDRQVIAKAIRQLRHEYADAYHEHRLRIRSRTELTETIEVEFRQIAIFLLHDAPPGQDLNVGVVISAEDAFDRKVSPYQVAANCVTHVNCLTEKCEESDLRRVSCKWVYDYKELGLEEYHETSN